MALVAGFGLTLAVASAIQRTRYGRSDEGAGSVAAPRSVILIVLDTFRRDHATPCGGPAEQTPNLTALAARGLTLCGLTVPGSWTLPVHASLFTGLPVVEHGADFAIDGFSPGEDFDPGFLVRPLAEEFETLAEKLAAAGFRTALISGNPLLGGAVGLDQGFDIRRVESRFQLARNGFLWRRVAAVARQLRSAGRAFLFVNVALAHDPFEFSAAAKGSGSGSQRQPILLYDAKIPERSLALRAESGDAAARSASQVAAVREAYAWGVRQADRDLGWILQGLRAEGLLGPDSLLVVTTDHGEFLGEQGRFDHRRSVDDPVTCGFAVIVGPGVIPGSASEVPLQSEDLHELLAAASGGRADHVGPWLQRLEARSAPTWSVSLPDPHFLRLSGGRLGGYFEIVGRSREGRVRWRSELWGGGRAWIESGNSRFAAVPPVNDVVRLGTRLQALRSPGPLRLSEEQRQALTAAGYLSP
ncbi:MAG: sulfatase-like hydrolase/transferase [Rhodocyclaceae bacterium]|nr:sulfatase-like hydrolase/transferase [Rhodocyclaceae bacterium]